MDDVDHQMHSGRRFQANAPVEKLVWLRPDQSGSRLVVWFFVIWFSAEARAFR